jgi:hypothetical protein
MRFDWVWWFNSHKRSPTDRDNASRLGNVEPASFIPSSTGPRDSTVGNLCNGSEQMIGRVSSRRTSDCT